LRSKLDAQRKTLDEEQQKQLDAQHQSDLAAQQKAALDKATADKAVADKAAADKAAQEQALATQKLKQQEVDRQAAAKAAASTQVASSGGGGGGAAAASATGDETRDAIPVTSIRVRYPANALRNNVEGWVDVQYTVGADGTPGNISVVNAEPRHVFDSAAMDAIKRTKFSPAVRDGTAVAVQQQKRIEFKLNTAQ
jgi:protein TonB